MEELGHEAGLVACSTWNAVTRHPWNRPAPMSSGHRLAPPSRWNGLRTSSTRSAVVAPQRVRERVFHVERRSGASGASSRWLEPPFGMCTSRGRRWWWWAPAHRIDSRMRSAWCEFLALGEEDARADACTSAKWVGATAHGRVAQCLFHVERRTGWWRARAPRRRVR